MKTTAFPSNALVEPFVDIKNVRDVFVLTDFEGKGEIAITEQDQDAEASPSPSPSPVRFSLPFPGGRINGRPLPFYPILWPTPWSCWSSI